MKYILFDLDGTLTDPMEGITKSVEYALNKFNISVKDRNDLISFIGPPLIDSFMEKYSFSKERAVKAVAYYREYFSVTGIFENKVYEGVIEMLSKLKSQGYLLILATSKPETFAKQILEHFKLAKYFHFIAGATMDEKRSYKDQIIEYALDSINFNDTDFACMVGDRCYDILGGKKFGIKTVGVLYGYGEKEELENCQPDFIAEDINDLYNFLKNL